MINRLIGLAAFQNPDFYKTQAMRLSTYGKPRVIGCAEDFPKHIALPRGCLQPVLDLFNGHAVKPVLHDERNHGQPIEVGFVGTLSMLQDGAARGVMAQEIGILSATTAFGKTVVAANIIATRKVNTLVLVHRRELMDQWKERLKTFLEVHESDIGIVGGGKDKRTGKIDIAVIQSLNIKGQVKEYISDYGQIIVDECHHVSAYSYEQVLKMAKAKYVVGLTATLARQDGHHPIVLMQCGPIRIRIDAKSQASARGMEHKVIPRYTSFQLPKATGNLSIQDIYQLLIEDEERNSFIFDDILNCLDQGRSPVLLAERTAHVEYFEKRLEKFAKNVIVLRGGMGKKQREAVRQKIAGIKDHEERVFIATGKLIGEGFDDARLDTLFLVHPVSWKGTLQQYAGRLHRSHINKTEVQIYDYIDLQVPMLKSMYKKRIHGYRAMGYKGFEL
jgi:superfamily II DNA or RNA helicase